MRSLVTIIGRGHSGTRAMSHTLRVSGVYMGEPRNNSGDLLPPEAMYEACRVFARKVRYLGDFRWDFSGVLQGPLDPAFTRLVESYLSDVLASNAEHKGWKIPETTLVYPWITRIFPEARYIHWYRDPRDAILGKHKTDRIQDFAIPFEPVKDLYLQRLASWKYQALLMKATPPPRFRCTVRFEDFVLRQDETLIRLERFLGYSLARIEVRSESVGRWKMRDAVCSMDLVKPEMAELGYG